MNAYICSLYIYTLHLFLSMFWRSLYGLYVDTIPVCRYVSLYCDFLLLSHHSIVIFQNYDFVQKYFAIFPQLFCFLTNIFCYFPTIVLLFSRNYSVMLPNICCYFPTLLSPHKYSVNRTIILLFSEEYALTILIIL